MKSHLWQPTISKFSGGPCPWTLLGWLTPSNLALIYTHAMLYWTPVESSSKNPNQISGSRLPKDTDQETAPWRLCCTYKNIIVGKKWYFYMTIKSAKYTHRKVNMCAKKWVREES